MIEVKNLSSLTNQLGETKNIIVKAKTPNTLKDVFVGGAMIFMGITYLTVAAFKHGAKAYEIAEFNTMCDLGIITDFVDNTAFKTDYKKNH